MHGYNFSEFQFPHLWNKHVTPVKVVLWWGFAKMTYVKYLHQCLTRGYILIEAAGRALGMGIPQGLPNLKDFMAARAWSLSSHSQWGSQIRIEVACGHNDCSLLAPIPTHLLRLQNPLGSQTFSTSVSQKKHDLCWLDYKYLLQFTVSRYGTPNCSCTWSWRLATVI